VRRAAADASRPAPEEFAQCKRLSDGMAFERGMRGSKEKSKDVLQDKGKFAKSEADEKLEHMGEKSGSSRQRSTTAKARKAEESEK
jgi:hypothetical protein